MDSERFQRVRAAVDRLEGVQLDVLKLPQVVLEAFEPSQIGTIVGTLMDACIPQLEKLLPGNDLLAEIGLSKAPGLLGDREGYPDYIHSSGMRLELKLLYVDPRDGLMKKVATRREASARLTQKVTLKNVRPEDDLLMVVAYQLRPHEEDRSVFSPTILSVGLFPVIECVLARDHRLKAGGGRWFGDFETPAVLSRRGRAKRDQGIEMDSLSYGRKESEGRDFNEDTNFGKLKRIPYRPLQEFLQLHGCTYASRGDYPEPWVLPPVIAGPAEALIIQDARDDGGVG